MNKKLESNNMFFIIIGVLTFLVTIVGATTAWYTATATSGKEELLTTGTLTINYNDGSKIVAANLKPATAAQVGQAYANNTCAHGGDPTSVKANETICTIYQFTVTNTGTLYANLEASFADFAIVDSLAAEKRAANGNTPITADTNGYFKYDYASHAPGTAAEFTGSALTSATSVSLKNSTLAPNGSTTGYIIIWLDSAAGNTYQGVEASASLVVNAVQTNKVTPTEE